MGGDNTPEEAEALTQACSVAASTFNPAPKACTSFLVCGGRQNVGLVVLQTRNCYFFLLPDQQTHKEKNVEMATLGFLTLCFTCSRF